MSSFLVLLVSAVACTVLTGADEEVAIPAGIKTCKRDADDYSSCLRLALQESWPVIVKGLPEVGLPVLDPLVSEFSETRYKNGGFQGKATPSNVHTYGLSNIRFLAVRPEYSGDRFDLEVDMFMPKVLVEGDYVAEGNLGSFRAGGKGSFNVSIEDMKVTWTINGHVKDDRWILDRFSAMPQISKMKVWFDDLFNGNEELNKLARSFVNEFWPTLYRAMLPYVSDTWSDYFLSVVNPVLAKLPFSKLFP